MSKLTSLLCGVTGGPESPPRRITSGVCSRSRARAFVGPWHSAQYCLKIGWMSRAKSIGAWTPADGGGELTGAEGTDCARSRTAPTTRMQAEPVKIRRGSRVIVLWRRILHPPLAFLAFSGVDSRGYRPSGVSAVHPRGGIQN